jgi:hypothetical protein
MKIDKFIDELFSNIMTQEGIDRIIEITKNEMQGFSKDYETAKVECQVFTEKDNYSPRVEISSEGYADGEVIFIDYHLDELEG